MIGARARDRELAVAPLDLTPLSDPIEVRVGGATLVAEAAGHGSTIVCLHAGVADRRSWRPVAPHLLDGHRVVAHDRRGFGDTDGTPEPFDHVADLLAVLDALHVEQALLVGNSQGGRVALETALEHPDRVEGLVLVAAAYTGRPSWEEPWPDALQSLDATLDVADEREDVDEVNRLEALLWLDGWAGPEGRVAGAARDLFLDMNRRALAAPDPGEAMQHAPVWDRLGEIRCPTLVVECDLDLPWSRWVGARAAAAIPDATLHVLTGMAHLPGLEDPARLAALVREVAR